jgi:hypothetical protein
MNTFLSADHKKLKLKKNAMEVVDFEKEWKKDPKYKTELCKGFEARGVCVYGNKCRFAHGRGELFDKSVNLQNYKQKECYSFFQNGFCAYGYRCHFKHFTRKIDQINRSFYSYVLSMIEANDPTFNLNIFIYDCIGNSNLGTPECKKNINKTSLLNMSTASSNSMDSDGSDTVDNPVNNKRRLRVFRDILMKNVKKNLCTSFNNCDGSLINLNFQKSFVESK